jgi:ketosteroid isomerase-like protein
MSNTETVGEIYAAFGRGDVPFILDQLADGVSWDERLPDYGVPYLEPGSGRDHVAQFFQRVGTGLKFSKFEVEDVVGSGDKVVVLVAAEGTHIATGKSFVDYEAHIWTFGADGKVTAFVHLVDRKAHAEAAIPG